MWVTNSFATTLMVVACSTAAAQTLVGTASDATGIHGLVVDGKTYNVTFESGTFQGVFPGGLMFNGYDVGNKAAGDLAGAMEQFSVLGIDRMNCVEGCSVLVPYSVVDAAKDTWSAQVQTDGFLLPFYGPYWYVDEFPFGWCGCDYLSGASNFWWGVFTPVSTPEPATYGLMVLGLAAAMLVRPRRALTATWRDRNSADAL